jgi:hypothetical protein
LAGACLALTAPAVHAAEEDEYPMASTSYEDDNSDELTFEDHEGASQH